MLDTVTVILDLSENARTLLEQQGVNLYQELQNELPSLRFEVQQERGIAAGSKDLTTVILAVASLVSSLSPIILRILNQITPPNRSETWEIEEIEMPQPDGTQIVRKQVYSRREHRLIELEQVKLAAPESKSSSSEK